MSVFREAIAQIGTQPSPPLSQKPRKLNYALVAKILAKATYLVFESQRRAKLRAFRSGFIAGNM